MQSEPLQSIRRLHSTVHLKEGGQQAIVIDIIDYPVRAYLNTPGIVMAPNLTGA